MRKLVVVGNAAGLSTFKVAIGLMDKVLDIFDEVEAGRLEMYESTVVKAALLQVTLHFEKPLRARDYGRILDKNISDIRPEVAQKVATCKTMMTDIAGLMEDMCKGYGQMPSKKSGKEKQTEVGKEAAIKRNPLHFFLTENHDKTKEEKARLDCLFVATKHGRTRGRLVSPLRNNLGEE